MAAAQKEMDEAKFAAESIPVRMLPHTTVLPRHPAAANNTSTLLPLNFAEGAVIAMVVSGPGDRCPG